MMVTFISQCEKKSLNRTRRVLDAFADRIGSNTWQTVITQEGLLAVKKLLRKTASKSTAVSCHWIRSRSRSELVWVVGNRSKFNDKGVVPVNATQRNLINSHIENDWQYLPLIKALVAIAALLHDWGKASQLFQDKLKPNSKQGFKGDPIRHEWISCLLLNALIQSCQTDSEHLDDTGWLSALINGDIDEHRIKQVALKQVVKPLSNLPPMAKLVAWLVVSHHRLPLNSDNDFTTSLRAESVDSVEDILRRITQQWGYENRYDDVEYQQRVSECFDFPCGLMSDSTRWLSQIKKWAARLLHCEPQARQALDDGAYRIVLNHSRLCLMLGDHYYSSKEADAKWPNAVALFANTDYKTKALKQKLDEHLVCVARSGLRVAHLLPAFEQEPPVAQAPVALKKPSPIGYKWQDKAVTKIKALRADNPESQGFFAVNMASTGCGKTFANAKVMRALSDDGASLRFVLALGLRTLTLQTGDEYRERVGLDNSELAVLIGSRAVMELHKQNTHEQEEVEFFEESGSLSKAALLDEDVDYDCAIPEEYLATVLTCDRDKKFLYAPVLACTIDHLMSATQTARGGRYILPTLRLMSSDLVIDEIDDFSGGDLIAIGRLIHLAGMLGRKVMISSATIPPDLAAGYFKAYRDGWQLYCKTRNASIAIGCVWIDEFTTHTATNGALQVPDALSDYRHAHSRFIQKRVAKLRTQSIKRKASIEQCDSIFKDYPANPNDEDVIESKQQAYFKIIADSAFTKHYHHHTQDNSSGLCVSFGVIRMANISPCVSLTKYLLNMPLADDTQIRVMAYHSQQVLLLRHVQEAHLDQVLKRKEPCGSQPAAFSNAQVRKHLDCIKRAEPKVKNVIFILVATPVEEVGRDHDFDWAVIEPSSYRSIIQLAGRVRRHRASEVTQPNVSVLQYNWKGVKNKHRTDIPVFNRPGFEGNILLTSHDMNTLVDTKALAERVDAIPRIEKSENLQQHTQLIDLEHHVIRGLLGTKLKPVYDPATLQGYLTTPWFLTAYPQSLVPFRQGPKNIKIFLTYDEDTQQYSFCEKNEEGKPVGTENLIGIKWANTNNRLPDRLWLLRDYDNSMVALAERQGLSLWRASLQYGELSFPHNGNSQYEYSDQFGMVKI